MIANNQRRSSPIARVVYRALRKSFRSAGHKTTAAFARVSELRNERQMLQDEVPHIVVLREHLSWQNLTFFEWLNGEHAEISRRFRHTYVGSSTVLRTEGARLLVNAIADPVLDRDPKLFRRVEQIEAAFDQAGVAVINRAANLSHGIKSLALAILRQSGLKTAHVKIVRPETTFADIEAAVGLPFILRSDVEHTCKAHLIHHEHELDRVDRSKITSPVALQFLDTRHADGLYRKYRYVMAGEHGILRHLIVTHQWCAHAQDRLRSPAVLAEELEAIAGVCPFHEELNHGRQALGLEYVAFDYSVDADGNLVVWEPNPFPCLWASYNQADPYFAYQLPHRDRVYSMILRYYLEQSGLEQPLCESVQ